MPKDKKMYNLDLFTGEATGVLPASVSEGLKRKKENQIIKLREDIAKLKKERHYTAYSQGLCTKAIKRKEKKILELTNI